MGIQIFWSQTWKNTQFCFKNIMYFNLFHASFWHGKRNLASMNVRFLPFYQVTGKTQRECDACHVVFDGWWNKYGGSYQTFSIRCSQRYLLRCMSSLLVLYHQYMKTLLRNLALSIPSVLHLSSLESLQGFNSCVFRCDPDSLLSGIFPARGCMFSLFPIY